MIGLLSAMQLVRIISSIRRHWRDTTIKSKRRKVKKSRLVIYRSRVRRDVIKH